MIEIEIGDSDDPQQRNGMLLAGKRHVAGRETAFLTILTNDSVRKRKRQPKKRGKKHLILYYI